jgi:putative membrane protein
MNPKRSIAALALLLLAGWGCGADAPDTAQEAPAAELSTPAEEPAAAPLTDPQIAHVAVTANAIDIEAARLAETRTTTPEVLSFAQTMVTDHTAVNEQAAALAQRLGVTPEENQVSRSLQADAAAARGELEGLNGAAFDRAYIEREVGYHQAVLDALDQTLIPGATNEELRGLLQQVRPAIAAHLDHARALQDSLGATP